MAVLVFTIAALIGTVAIAAYGPQSWLCFWEHVGETKRDR
jgi:hypothetical protein